jgi:hypothetical protein
MKRILTFLVAVLMLVSISVPVMAQRPGDRLSDWNFGDIQPPVLLGGAPFMSITKVFHGNSAGKTVTPNSTFAIMVDGAQVGTVILGNPNTDGRVDITSPNASVTVRWQSGEFYAYATLDQVGTFTLPRIVNRHHNGRIDTNQFNGLWIESAVVNEPPEPSEGGFRIMKTVNGVPFGEWVAAKGLAIDAISELVDSMTFNAWLLTGKNGSRTGTSFPGVMALDGTITFATQGGLPVGWYEIAETFSGSGQSFFNTATHSEVVFLGRTGISSEAVSFVSGVGVGTGDIVSHDGSGSITLVLPDVWNRALANDSNFQAMRALGAQWVWDMSDIDSVFATGITGDAISLAFPVTVAADVTATVYFAADNAALVYVNGLLAAKTEVAFRSNSTIEIGDAYMGVNVFDKRDFFAFDGVEHAWQNVYRAELQLTAGENVINIVAANSASTGHIDGYGRFVRGTTGTPNDGYNLYNNPAGLIFAIEVPAVTFNNLPRASKNQIDLPGGGGGGD